MAEIMLPVMRMPRSGKEIESAQEVVDDLWPMAKEIFEVDGCHNPAVFVFTKPVLQIVDVTKMLEANEKDALSDMLKGVAKNPETEAIALVTEAWRYVAGDEMEAATAMREATTNGLADMPGRIEVLQIQVELRGGSTAMRWAEILRGDGKVSLGEVKEESFSDVSGRLCNFFE